MESWLASLAWIYSFVVKVGNEIRQQENVWWSCYVSFKFLNDQIFFYTDRNAPIMTTSRNWITWRECSVNLWGSIHRPPGIPCVLTSNSDPFIIQRTEEKLKFFLVSFYFFIFFDFERLFLSHKFKLLTIYIKHTVAIHSFS